MTKRFWRVGLAVAVLLLATTSGPASLAVYASHCETIAAFSELRAAVGGAVVGACQEGARTAADGSVHQRTTRGELVLRASDGRAVFTDGKDAWVIGPNGLRRRPNGEHFFWETVEAPTTGLRAMSTVSTEMPGALLPSHRIVTYYGNPLSKQMGILGEIPPEPMIARLKEQAAAYGAADPAHPVLPALELVATVAQAGPGADGMYRLRMDTELIEEVAGWAEQHGMLLFLDIQIGRSNVADEVKAMLPFLRRPYVHLALDPEFAMRPDQLPGKVIGSHSGEDVNVAIDILSELVAKENLPPKVLIVHRFTDDMLTDHEKIKTDPHVQVVVVMDGFGPPEVKLGTYDRVIRGHNFQHTGFKLFYPQDKPLMTPEQVLAVDPSPLLIIYQ
jgi:hypothetical protein